ncbi:MAG: chemotaxis protein CheA, partial [Caldimicrobium sp.]
MNMIDEDILKDFLAEAKYGIAKMEEEFIKLEKERENAEILKNLFRTVYALKEAAGFYGFKTLEKITHFAEDILAKLRDEVISADDEIIDVLLKCLKEIKYIVAYLEEHKSEPMEDRILEFLVELSNVNDKLKRIEKIKLMQEKEEVKEEATTVFEEILEKKITPSKEIIPNNDVLKEEKTEETEDLTPQIEFTDTYNKVDVKVLNLLVNLISELNLVKNRMIQLSNRLKDRELQRSVQALSKVTTELQETIMKTRMQPIAVIFNKFPKIVRDLARALNKKVNLHIEGADTELDRFIIKAIKDPLIHLVRNAINHGIEPEEIRAQVGKPVEGNLYLRAYHNGGQVVIEIEDDGKGIDIEKIKRKALENGLISEEEAKKLT